MKRPDMTRFIIALLLSTFLVAPIALASSAEIPVYVNGQLVTFDVPPTIVQDRTLVPMRAIFEALGATVQWNGETRSVSATWSGGEMLLPIGATTVKVNGKDRTLDVPAQIISDRTMVPLRFVSETLGAYVGWYGQARLITINKPAQMPMEVTVTRVTDGDTIEVALPGACLGTPTC